MMTGRERMLRTLRFEEPDRPPHFETMFELEQEAFGLRFPERTRWGSCGAAEKERMIGECMEIYGRIIERYQWDALAVYWPWSDADGVRAARAAFGQDILIGSIVGGCCWAIEQVTDWMEFSVDLHERPGSLHARAREMCDHAGALAEQLVDAGADFILLVNDIADNRGTFLQPSQMRELVLPYLGEVVARVRAAGAFAFIHTDGNIMSVLDEWIGLGADCYQSIDPMAGMDLATVKARCGKRLALMGNVQCSLLQDGPRAAIAEAVDKCLQAGAPGGGYIFSTSNTIFGGMPLAHYEYMLECFRAGCKRLSGEVPAE